MAKVAERTQAAVRVRATGAKGIMNYGRVRQNPGPFKPLFMFSTGFRHGLFMCYSTIDFRTIPSGSDNRGVAYTVQPESGEEFAAIIELNLSKKVQPFHFAVSTQAIYIPRIKLFAKTDPFYFQRVALDQIRHVAITRLRPYALWVLSVVMIVTGLVTTMAMIDVIRDGHMETKKVTGWPIAVFTCGFLVPFAAKRRFALEVWFEGGSYIWKPPLVVDKASKEKVSATLQDIAEACEEVGILVADERRNQRIPERMQT